MHYLITLLQLSSVYFSPGTWGEVRPRAKPEICLQHILPSNRALKAPGEHTNAAVRYPWGKYPFTLQRHTKVCLKLIREKKKKKSWHMSTHWLRQTSHLFPVLRGEQYFLAFGKTSGWKEWRHRPKLSKRLIQAWWKTSSYRKAMRSFVPRVVYFVCKIYGLNMHGKWGFWLAVPAHAGAGLSITDGTPGLFHGSVSVCTLSEYLYVCCESSVVYQIDLRFHLTTWAASSSMRSRSGNVIARLSSPCKQIIRSKPLAFFLRLARARCPLTGSTCAQAALKCVWFCAQPALRGSWVSGWGGGDVTDALFKSYSNYRWGVADRPGDNPRVQPVCRFSPAEMTLPQTHELWPCNQDCCISQSLHTLTLGCA